MHDTVNFDLDNIDAAFTELDARYLAGQAAAIARLDGNYGRLRLNQPTRTTPEEPGWVNIDHRRGEAFAPGDMTAYIHASLRRCA